MTGKKYKLMPIDADTPLMRAAISVEQNYVVVTYKGKSPREFANKTEFWGHHSKKDGGFLAEINQGRIEKGLTPFPASDFEIEQCVRPHPDVKKHIKNALKHFDNFIEYVKFQDLAQDYKILIAGGGNFRYAVAHTKEYKGGRPDKPIYYEKLKKAVIDKYGDEVELVYDIEVDDKMAVYGMQEDTLLAYVDKDLKMIPSPYINYDEEEIVVREISPLDGCRHYCSQLLSGDGTDNIQGLPNLVTELRERYGVRKGKGVGKAIADKYLESAETGVELFQRVVDAYRAYYGDDVVAFTDWRGNEQEWTWRGFLIEASLLLYMNPNENPLSYNVLDYMYNIGVDFSKDLELEQTKE